jgi:hypothetical protein
MPIKVHNLAMPQRKKLIVIGSLVLFFALIVCLTIPFARKKAEAVGCGNTMIAIGFAARYMWAEDHDSSLPTSVSAMSNEIVAAKILLCPGDHVRKATTNWASLTSENTSYEIVTPGLHVSDTNRIFLRCKIHGFVCYADGSVFDGNRKLQQW